MSDVRLYLDGCLVDIDPKTEVSETKQINNLFELRDRQTSYTNNFTLLLTNNTSQILDRLGDHYHTSNKPYRDIDVKLYRGGTPTITDGNFIIKSIDKKKRVKGNIQDGNSSIFRSMSNKSLVSLDFSSINHVLSQASYLDSFDNEWEDGYIYPIANYGVFSSASVKLKYQTPCLFFRWIWEQIFIDAGYTYTYIGANNPFETDVFKNMVLTLNKGFDYDETPPPPPVQVLGVSGNGSITDNNNNYLALNDFNDPDNLHNVVNGESIITVNDSAYYELQVNSFTTNDATIYVLLDGVQIATLTGAQNYSETFLLDNTNDIKFYVQGNPNYTYSISVQLLINSGVNTVNFSNYFQNIKQSDFFKSVLQYFGLMFQRERGTNNYNFITVQDMVDNRLDAQDLSDSFYKCDSEVYNFGSYGKNNFMRYRYDDDNASFADGSFPLDNDNLKDNNTLFILPYKAPTIDDGLFNNELIYNANLFEPEIDENGTVTGVKSLSTNPYVFTLNKQNVTFTYEIDGITYVYNGVAPIGSFDDVTMKNFIDNYYFKLKGILNRGRVFNVELSLSAKDVYEFDFLKLVYLRQYQKYFYCNKIKNFKENKITKVELVSVTNG